MSQANKIAAFKALHKKGKPLVLINVWDAGTAQAVADAGAPALATASWSCAAAHGFEDDESFPIELALANVQRIVNAVDRPVSFDFEGGYATEPERVAQHVAQAAEIGIAGINLEDRRPGETEPLALQAATARIQAARQAAPLFINARLDAFLASDPSQHESLLDDAIARARAFVDAGADGIFVPALGDVDLLTRFCEACPAPVNAMAGEPRAQIDTLSQAGVARISSGPGPYRALMKQLGEMARGVYGSS